MQTNRCLRSPRRPAAGFTLIELMIAVAIVGILVSVAYPAYTQSVLKSHRAEAKAALLDLAAREERYFSTTNTYTDTGSLLGYGTGITVTTAAPLAVMTGSSSYYNLSVSVPAAATSPSFTATATATGSQVGDAKCKNFSLTQSGIQSVSGTDTPGNCW
jgi:type IV pilus assembly protein PilE